MQLNKRDVNFIVRRLPKTVRELLKDRSDIFLAGGFIRSVIASEEVHDIDLFAPSKDVAYLVALGLANGEKPQETGNAYSIKVNGIFVQVIHRWTYTNPQECIESFDFTIASAAIWFSARVWCSICDKEYYQDLASKRLVYRSPKRNEDAGGSILRVLKFYQRGYHIPLDSMGAVIARLVSGVDHSKCTSEEQVAKVVTGLLLEVDPNIAIPIAEEVSV